MFARISARKRSIGFSIAILMLMVGGRFLLVSRGTAAAPAPNTTNAPTSAVSSSSLGQFSPTFAGPAATGCTGYGCSLLTGPFFTPSTAPLFSKNSTGAKPPTESSIPSPSPKVMPSHSRPRPPHGFGPNITITPPSVSCQPLGPGCDIISSFSGGATGVKGLNAVDSATQPTNVSVGDIEPPDQGLCAGNGFVVESNNIGEILVFDTNLQRKSAVIPWTPLWDSRAEDGAVAETFRASTITTTAGTGSLRRLSLQPRSPLGALLRAALPAWPIPVMKELR